MGSNTCVCVCVCVSDSLPPPGLQSLAMGFSREEYWSGLPFPSPGDLLDSETEHKSPALQADSSLSETPGNMLIVSNEIISNSMNRLGMPKNC